MKKYIVLLFALVVTIALCACKEPAQQTAPEATQESTAATAAPTTAPTAAPTAPPTTAPTIAPTTAPTEPSHSELYIEGVSQDQMVDYFNEVVLNIEYSTGDGDASLVQKWDRTIYYRIEGVPTQKDAKVLSNVINQLNTIEGFPGIQVATGLEQNLTIFFLKQAEFNAQFSSVINSETADGAVQFWYYTGTNNIHTGRVGYRKDIAQEVRDSVISEELVNLLGVSDTATREDSITYQYGSEVTELSVVDWVILKLLYNPKIECGMDAAACETIIRELYY